jgi:hypothetical protein
MIRTMIVAALLLVSQSAAAQASTACAGVNLALDPVAVTKMSSNGTLNRYELSGTVTNSGSAAQASDVLQSVDIYARNVKIDTKSIPPLKPGESYTFSYASMRSRDAGDGTTQLAFQLAGGQPAAQDCRDGTSRQTVTF